MSKLPLPRVLLGPGPSMVSPRVLQALGAAPVGYLDPELFTDLAELQELLRPVFGTRNRFTLPLTGTGMAGMEACLANLIEPGDNVLVGIHGFFGGRMAEIAGRLGAEVTRVEAAWGQPIEPEAMKRAAEEVRNLKLVCVVHAETSTGVRQPLEEIGRVAREHDALFLVDCVTSLGGIEVGLDAVGADAAYSGTQKCMGCPPGLSPISVSDRALQAAFQRKSPCPSWYFDWKLLDGYWHGDRVYHHTVPVNLLAALLESLREISEEGLPARWQRHQQVSDELIAGLKELGITPFAAEGYRLPTLNSVTIPEGVDDTAVRNRLLQEFGIEIGGGFGALKGRIWRIGTMGYSASRRNAALLLQALRVCLR
jgi:alanine-glyoxylate transaminase/serine-glyoxylate transaminase/serine-pyruvate transaminase